MFHGGGRMPTDRARVLVLGDSGSGKTALLHLFSHDEVLRGQYATTGCHIEVKLHRTSQGNKSCFVELWDIGGSQQYRDSRGIFYTQPVHGLLLVHDASNVKSFQNLRRWIKEVSEHGSTEDEAFDKRSSSANGTHIRSAAARSLFSGSATSPSHDMTVSIGSGEQAVNVPCLVVGTHSDTVTGSSAVRAQRLSEVIADPEEFKDDDNLVVDATDAATFSASSLATRRFRYFLDRVVDARLHHYGGVSAPALSAALGPGGVVSGASWSQLEPATLISPPHTSLAYSPAGSDSRRLSREFDDPIISPFGRKRLRASSHLQKK